METKSQFFEKVNKMSKSLVRSTRRKRERTNITGTKKIRNERGNITVDTTEIEHETTTIICQQKWINS